MVGSPANTRMLRVFANCSSAEPGSVIAMNCSLCPSVFVQKYSKWDSVSSVPPDFDETTNIVLLRSSDFSACRIIAGCPLQHLRCERRAAHAEQDERLERLARLGGEPDDLAGPLLHALGLVEPA